MHPLQDQQTHQRSLLWAQCLSRYLPHMGWIDLGSTNLFCVCSASDQIISFRHHALSAVHVRAALSRITSLATHHVIIMRWLRLKRMVRSVDLASVSSRRSFCWRPILLVLLSPRCFRRCVYGISSLYRFDPVDLACRQGRS